MGKTESAVIAVFLLMAFPFSLFILGWWASASLFIYGAAPIPEYAIAFSAFAGLALGIVIAVLRLKHWVPQFYDLRKGLAVLVYLFWSAVATAFFMGLPIGVLALGLLAGFYIGRRGRHADMEDAPFKKEARQAALFLAAVVGLVSLAMGTLAIQEQRSMQHLLALIGLGRLAESASGRTAVVAVAVPILVAMQYVLARAAASWGFKLGGKKA